LEIDNSFLKKTTEFIHSKRNLESSDQIVNICSKVTYS
jgi:hypothetical protein